MIGNEQDLEILKRRFGDDPSSWPSPYRKLLGDAGDEDAIDRLVREAAVSTMRNDRLVHRVLGRLDVERGARQRPAWQVFTSPRLVMLAGFALIIAAASGFQVARLDGLDPEATLLAVAAGAPTAIILDDDVDLKEVGL
ncbi:hypothetical protein [Rhizobium sp. FY34]|uniref:hypothetical protein n=1 Tax=Rhizobium sp. FY34 TaxID=2562309 RepID=UPI0010C11439|nr:hypothetical protein [Rhizobium sp. FY34]